MSKDIEAFLVFWGVASVIGALISLGLSFTALSPLLIGGIFGSIVPVLLVICSFIPEVEKVFPQKEKGSELVQAA